ncbi:MAG: hypothetical protein ACKVQJ_00510 [Pyrinomonadaceae bacterium]
MKQNFSQAGQDLFVLSALDGKRDGVFLDLGCNQPILINNTYLLESGFGWKGLSIDIDEEFFELFVFRKTKTLAADCTRLDWDAVLDLLETSSIDYLSLDLEPPMTTLECLRSIPFDKMSFGVITFEHDAYRAGETVREPSRKLIEENGYIRLCSDVKLYEHEFEDWYYNPKLIDGKRCAALASTGKNWEEILFD